MGPIPVHNIPLMQSQSFPSPAVRELDSEYSVGSEPPEFVSKPGFVQGKGLDNVLEHRVAIDLLSQRQVFIACLFLRSDAVIDVSCGCRLAAIIADRFRKDFFSELNCPSEWACPVSSYGFPNRLRLKL
jgi:hypothetical protein